ncbi:MAG: apolipoprotein N-acyltransferase [Isosphaeraceae bacterium]
MSIAPSPPGSSVRAEKPAALRRPDPRQRVQPVAAAWLAGSSVATWIGWVAGVTVLGLAWLVPETVLAAGLAWIAALAMVHAMRSGRGYLAAYVGGIVGHIIAFHWVFGTVASFGGFPVVGSAAVFALFVASGAIQFPTVALIHRLLPGSFDALALRAPTAVVLAELLIPRLFPWSFGHTQIAFTPLVQVAGLGGSMAVSFLVFWIAEVAVRVVAFRERRWPFVVPVAALGLALAYGMSIVDQYGSPRGVTQQVIVVQGHVANDERRDIKVARQYLARIFDLSRKAASPGSLIVWPEGAVPVYLPAAIGTVGDPPVLPWSDDGSAYLVGAYSFLPNEEKFNAAFAVYPDGQVPLPYFKQVLIPFGEAMPLASYFPALRQLNARAGAFSAGTETKVFEYPMRRADGSSYTLKLSPLICYEDTVPGLSREAAQKGAELLVNITSDAWFGRSLAPRQHHLIAAFRAIENRRYLIRSTTTGYSAVVDPLGRTIGRIDPFSEGTITATVGLLPELTPYTSRVGDRPWWCLLAVAAVLRLGKTRPRGWFAIRRSPESATSAAERS